MEPSEAQNLCLASRGTSQERFRQSFLCFRTEAETCVENVSDWGSFWWSGGRVPDHGSTIESPWNLHGISMESPWNLHGGNIDSAATRTPTYILDA